MSPRHQIIAAILDRCEVSSQGQLVELLAAEDIHVTQATVSRDLDRLGAVRVRRGGHMVYALWPRAHRWVSWIVVLFLIYLGWHFVGWRLWAAMVAAMNIVSWRQQQAPYDPGIRGFRVTLALLGLLMLVLTFTVVPFRGENLGLH